LNTVWEIDKIINANGYVIICIVYNGTDNRDRKTTLGEIGYIRNDMSYGKLLDNLLFQGYVNNHLFMKPDYKLGGIDNRNTGNSVYICNLSDFDGKIDNVWSVKLENSYYYNFFTNRGMSLPIKQYLIIPGRVDGALYGDETLIAIFKPPYMSFTFVKLPANTCMGNHGGCADLSDIQNEDNEMSCEMQDILSENASTSYYAKFNYITGKVVSRYSVAYGLEPEGKIDKYHAIGVNGRGGILTNEYINEGSYDYLVSIHDIQNRRSYTYTIPDCLAEKINNAALLGSSYFGGYDKAAPGYVDILNGAAYIHGTMGGAYRTIGLWYMKNASSAPIKIMNEVISSVAMSNSD
jgi:hypothetical protein